MLAALRVGAKIQFNQAPGVVVAAGTHREMRPPGALTVI